MPFLSPLFIDNMGWHMAEVYGAVTDQILINLARYFPYYKPGQSVPQSSFEYQANMLAQMGQVTKDTIQIIRASLGDADNALTNVLEQAIMEAVKKAQPELFKAVQKGLLNPTQRPVVDPSQMRAYQLYYQQAAQKLNMVNTVMLESTKQAYQATVSDIAARVQVTQNALDIGAAETVTGVSSWNQALRHSIDRMKQNGITGFIDHAGHKWSAEAYTSMDIRTTVANTARAAVWETNQNFGNDLYIVSYHDGARPLCYPWQNKVISSTDNARVVQDLDGNEIQVIAQKDTSYGEPAGLFGINCKHYPSPFIPGVSVLYDQSNIMSEKENAKVYEQTQQQRALERQIREQKRDLLMAKAQGADKEELRALRDKIRETDDEIDAFCNETGLPRRQSRESAFTQRSFPPEDTYDVDTFERTQKEAIDKYFNDGGSQQGFTFGTMTPNEPIKEMERTPEESEFSFLPSNRNTVREEYIESQEYAERFVGITGNAKTDNAIATVSQEMLMHRSGTNYEDLALIDADTGKVLHVSNKSNKLFGVSYDSETQRVIAEAKKANKRIISVHNHPNNYPPSLDDGSSGRLHGYIGGVVVGHDGSIYTYTPTANVLQPEQCKQIHGLIRLAIDQSLSIEPWFTMLETYGMIITKR